MTLNLKKAILLNGQAYRFGRDSGRQEEVLKFFHSKGRNYFGRVSKAKIYGRLGCLSGKRMKVEHRVFFKDETDAINNGYRPCSHCMRKTYLQWKAKL